MARTPTPWELIEATRHHGPYIVSGNADACDFYYISTDGAARTLVPFANADANAAFVLLAVNSHDALVEALKLARERFAQIECQNITGQHITDPQQLIDWQKAIASSGFNDASAALALATPVPVEG